MRRQTQEGARRVLERRASALTLHLLERNRLATPVATLACLKRTVAPASRGAARRVVSMATHSTAADGGAPTTTPGTLEALVWDNRSLRELPVDTTLNARQRRVEGACFSLVRPTPVSNPLLVAVSPPALAELGISLEETKRPDFAAYFAGNKVLPGAEPAAHCYAGHQFGGFSGQLGDGATMYLGEVVTPPSGARVELQFKGAGKTPYSRTADGRKVLRSSLREFLCSELMAALGIPTTRAPTVVTSDTRVARDIFYSGDVIQERASIITRTAPSFLRFGSFEIFCGPSAVTGRDGPSSEHRDLLPGLLDYVCRYFYPETWAGNEGNPSARWTAMYRSIVSRSARLVAAWQAQGWAHGVLNTDNMSILGVTLDYGPYGWMDRYDPNFVCNASDDGGRYSFANQPHAVRWNCGKLADAFRLAPALTGVELTSHLPTDFDLEFETQYVSLMRRKLGLVTDPAAIAAALPAATVGASGPLVTLTPAEAVVSGLRAETTGGVPPPQLEDPDDGDWGIWLLNGKPVPAVISGEDDDEGGSPSTTSSSSDGDDAMGGPAAGAANPTLLAWKCDVALIRDLLSVMHKTGADYTATLRALGEAQATRAPGTRDETLEAVLENVATVREMAAAARPSSHDVGELTQMLLLARRAPHLARHVPVIEALLQQHAAAAALASRLPEEKEAEDRATWAAWLARYRAALASYCSAAVASGSYPTPAAWDAARFALAARHNPRYVLRNWIAQRAITKAEGLDFSEVQRVLGVMLDPYGLRDGTSSSSTASAGGGTGALDLRGTHAPAGQGEEDDADTANDYACRPPPWAADLKVT